MALRDFFSGRRRQTPTLPRNAKLARRRRHNGGSDVGYWSGSQFFLLDGTLTDRYEYFSGTGDVLSTQVAQVELERAGYDHDANYYTAPSDTSSSNDGDWKSYDGGWPTRDTSTDYSSPAPSSSSDSGSSYGGSSYGGSSSDSGSSYGGGSSSSSSSDSGSSSSSSSDY